MNASHSAADGTAVIAAIRRIVRAVQRASRTARQDTGLTVPQQLTLQALADSPEGTTASALLPKIQVSPGTLSGIVDHLAKAGLVCRERAPNDRRSVRLTLTEAGRHHIQTTRSTLHERVVRRVRALPPEESHALLLSLEHVCELLEASGLDASPVLTGEEPIHTTEISE